MSDTKCDDMLRAMWERQGQHYLSEKARYAANGRAPADATAEHLAWCRHLGGEVDELMRCVDWKVHQAGRKASQDEIITECVDVWKFLLNLMLLHGFTHEEFFDAFREKSRVVEERAKFEAFKAETLAAGTPILLVDAQIVRDSVGLDAGVIDVIERAIIDGVELLIVADRSDGRSEWSTLSMLDGMGADRHATQFVDSKSEAWAPAGSVAVVAEGFRAPLGCHVLVQDEATAHRPHRAVEFAVRMVQDSLAKMASP